MDSKFRSMGFSGIFANSSVNALHDIDGLLPGANGADVCIDTVLRLNSLGSSVPLLPISKGIKRKWACIDGNISQETKVPLVLGGVAHYSSSLSERKSSSATARIAFTLAKGIELQPSVDLDREFSLQLGMKISSSTKKVAANIDLPSKMVELDLELSLCTWPLESDITSVHGPSSVMQVDIEEPSFHAPQTKDSGHIKLVLARPGSSPFGSFLSASTTAAPKSSITCTSGSIHPQQVSNSKLCKFIGCSKGARGASGLCISHGGGRRCQRTGCDKGTEGKTSFYKAHRGGKRCQFLGCIKSAEGHTELCIAHGGGRRCSHEGCTKTSRGKSGLCICHGGGKRCQRENCTRSAEGISGLCISHGGGRRCQYQACDKGSQGSTMFCKARGGGKRCTIEGCTKGAEGSTPLCKSHGGGKRCSSLDCPKSVHGGTSFCVAHGGGKRCASSGCGKSARGRTEFCVRHGGGKRCKFQSCGKSAQGSTDFCKAHGGGGGKRCLCGSSGRSKTRLCPVHDALIQDKRIHGGFTLGPLLQVLEDIQIEFEEDVNADYVRSHCGEATMAEWSAFDMNQNHFPSSSSVPEGRVHGGSLLALLRGASG